MKDDDLRFAIQDGNQRINAQYDLAKFNDQKALSLISLYVTLGIATVGFSLTYFGKDAWLPASASFGIAGSAVCLFVGALCCFSAMKSTPIDLPGRGFDFWIAVQASNDITFNKACLEYMNAGQAANEGLKSINARAASKLRLGQKAGIAAPVVAAILGLGFEIAKRYC